MDKHLIPENKSTKAHIDSPNCWCQPTFVSLGEGNGTWKHRGELINGDVNESYYQGHNLMEDRKYGF